MKVILSGGGTGGHIYPALAVADALRSRIPDVRILFVGARGRMEMEKVPAAGYAIRGLWISGLQRRLTVQNLLFPVKVLSSVIAARRIAAGFRPDVVAGFGGYVSGPMLRAAASLGIPTVLQEQNSYAGLTNRLLARKAAAICVAYPGMEKFFPAGKVIVTGNPVRSDLQGVDRQRNKAQAFFRLDPGKKTILLFGGSLGARTLNEAMRTHENFFREHETIQVLWQMGKLYTEQYSKCGTARLANVRPLPFIDRMDLAYAVADVVICRAGALTISELCLAGKAAILVPSPNVAEDHQTRNARALAERGAAVMVRDDEAQEVLFTTAADLLGETGRLRAIQEAASALAMPSAADDIVDVIVKAAGR